MAQATHTEARVTLKVFSASAEDMNAWTSTPEPLWVISSAFYRFEKNYRHTINTQNLKGLHTATGQNKSWV